MAQQTELRRSIGRWDLTAVAVNGIVGAGIFGLPAQAFALTGVWSLAALVACAAIASLVALCFAEVGSRFRESGGPYLYAREGLGAGVGFTAGWIWYLARAASYAANLNLMITYAGLLIPWFNQPVPHAAAAIVVTLGFLALNIHGVPDSTMASNVLALAKLAALVGFVVFGFFFIEPARLSPGPFPPGDKVAGALLILFYAFTGFEIAAVPAGEVQNPRRDLPRALITGIATATLLYAGIQAVCVGTLPGLATSQRPLADAAQLFAGRAGAVAIVTIALISILGNLNMQFLVCSRIPFAMGKAGELPRILGAVHPTRHTPWAALVLTAVTALLPALSRSFLSAVTVSSAGRLIVFGATAIALLRLRARKDAPEAKFLLPFAPVLVTMILALVSWLLWHVSKTELTQAAWLTAAGLAAYFVGTRKNRSTMNQTS